MGINLYNLGFGNGFLNDTKSTNNQRKHKLDFHTIKKSHESKDNMKKKPTEQEKVFANYTSDKDLITKTQ